MTPPRTSNSARCLVLLAGFALAIVVRVLIGGPGVAQSAPAGLAFAGCLAALGLAARTRLDVTLRALAIGLAGGFVLCLPALIARTLGSFPPAAWHGYLPWALVVTLVAVAEEYFLRGALFNAANQWLGEAGAIILTAIAFAGLHVPLYGWHVIPLDFAVGLWLGSLRLVSNTWAAPAIAHTLADLLSWWLR